MRRTIADGLILMLLLNVPATIGLAVLATPIVQLMYERGAFTPRETLATAAALQLYAVGLLGYSVVRIASPAFYAIGSNRTPVIVSIITVAVNAVLNMVLVRTMGYTGLASARRSRRCSTQDSCSSCWRGNSTGWMGRAWPIRWPGSASRRRRWG